MVVLKVELKAVLTAARLAGAKVVTLVELKAQTLAAL